jgi:hypothetical protein
MKKPLIITMIMLLGLSACQKEASNVKSASANEALTSASKKNLGTDVTQQQVVPMTLIARQPGETFDTYEAIYNGVGVKVTGPLSRDLGKYPGIVDGVPVFGNLMSTYGVEASISSVNSGPDGNVFEVYVPILGGVASSQFTTDMNNYITGYSNWANSVNPSPSTTPLLFNYVKTSYTSGDGKIVTYTGKLVLTTTGSGLAIAPVTYPLPGQTVASVGNLSVIILDPNISTASYQLNGVNCNFTSGIEGVYNGTTTTTNFTNSTNVVVTGTYTSTPGTGIYHYWGTVIRPDGTSFNFNITQSLE